MRLINEEWQGFFENDGRVAHTTVLPVHRETFYYLGVPHSSPLLA